MAPRCSAYALALDVPAVCVTCASGRWGGAVAVAKLGGMGMLRAQPGTLRSCPAHDGQAGKKGTRQRALPGKRTAWPLPRKGGAPGLLPGP